MGSRLTRVLAVLAATALLVVGANVAAYAATGKSLILGKTNKAGKVTTVQRTTTGPALNIKTKKSTSAPFTTNAKGKVKNLNADKLDGYDSATLIGKSNAALAAAGDVQATKYQDATGTRVGDTTYSVGPQKAGTYLVTFNADVFLGTTATVAAPQTMTCALYVLSGFIGATTYAQAQTTIVAGTEASPSFSNVLTLTGTENLKLGCDTTAGTGWSSVSGFLFFGQTPSLSFTKLDGAVAKSMIP